MKFYEEIVNFIRANTMFQGQSLMKSTRKHNRSDELYQLLLDKKVKGDEEAAQFFFGVWDHKYKRLRQRFINSLTTSVLQIDWNGDRSLSPHQKGYYNLLRERTAARILYGKGLYKSGIFYAKRCYRKAKELCVYEIMEDTALMLMEHYGARMKRQKEFEFYEQELKKVVEYRRIERLADIYYSRMYVHQSKNMHDSQGRAALYQEYYNDLSLYLSSCDSFRYQLITRIIQSNIHSIRCDFAALYVHCCECVNYYLDRKILHKTSLYIFLNQQATACIRSGYYEQGLETIKQSLKLLKDDNVNWYPIKYNEFFLYMQSGQYVKAHDVYSEVFRKRRYNNIPPYMKESWAVAEAYLHYVIEAGLLEIEKPAKFRVGRFLNTVPEYSKDKRVQNIPILIIQILFMLLRERTDEAIDRIEAIEKYCARHLRYNEAVRSNAFIMMLLQIPKASFSRLGVERRIKKYTDKLQEVKIHQSGKAFDLELIPYERLWGYALGSLR